MSARGKGLDGGGTGASRTFQAPAGFRDSPEPALASGEVVASQYSTRRLLARIESGAVFEAWDMIIERTVVVKVGWRDPGAPSLVAEARRCAGVATDAAVGVFAIGNHRGAEFVVGERLVATTLRDHVGAAGPRLGVDELVRLFGRLARAVDDTHAAGFTIGDLAAETLGLVGARRVVFGRFSLGQVAAVGPTGLCLAPEVVLGQAAPTDPTAAIGIDLYGLGCLGLELALGRAPFATDSTQALLTAHARTPAPTLADYRPDLPAELGDLIGELCAKDPGRRPVSAAAVVAQLDIIGDRVAANRRGVRILIVDDDGDRVRAIWSAARRAHPRAQIDAARDGREAASKLTRDRPELVFIDAALGVAAAGMNALELVMFARGLEDAAGAALVVYGDGLGANDRGVLAQFGARLVGAGPQLATVVAELVQAASTGPRTTASRRTVSG
ncbi:MAG: hypothetical protein R3B06_13645 [Kofleriaceae bacterium]